LHCESTYILYEIATKPRMLSAAVVLSATISSSISPRTSPIGRPLDHMGSHEPRANSTIYWRNLSVTAGDATLVHQHSGAARAGRLLGVLGPSGAGKSSLLNALGGVLPTTTRVRGAIWQVSDEGHHVDGASCEWHAVGVGAGTVALLEQDDAFFPELTVSETLQFASTLDGVPTPRAKAEVRTLLQQVGLEAVASRQVGERRIGTSLRGISGGERRRLAVACAIAGEDYSGGGASMPRALLADEPTTGLDAFQAERVVRLLRSLAQSRGCAAVTTLHQPRGSIWRELDDVMLMAPGGHIVYCGARADVLGYFKRLGIEPPSDGTSTAEFLIDLVSINTEDLVRAAEDRARIQRLATAFKHHQSRSHASWPAVPPELRQQQRGASGGARQLNVGARGSLHRVVDHARTPLRVFGHLLKRSLLQNARDVRTTCLRFCSTVGLAFIFGAQFGVLDGGGAPTAKSVTSRVALLSYGAISMGMLATMRALDRFAKERPVVGRERTEGKYSGATYLIAKVLSEIPSDAAFSAAFALVLKSQCGLQAPLGAFVAVHALVAATSSALGLAVGAAAPRAEQALAVGAPIMVIHMLVS
jgi:ABC-type multidrug transport system ATPase subunit